MSGRACSRRTWTRRHVYRRTRAGDRRVLAGRTSAGGGAVDPVPPVRMTARPSGPSRRGLPSGHAAPGLGAPRRHSARPSPRARHRPRPARDWKPSGRESRSSSDHPAPPGRRVSDPALTRSAGEPCHLTVPRMVGGSDGVRPFNRRAGYPHRRHRPQEVHWYIPMPPLTTGTAHAAHAAHSVHVARPTHQRHAGESGYIVRCAGHPSRASSSNTTTWSTS